MDGGSVAEPAGTPRRPPHAGRSRIRRLALGAFAALLPFLVLEFALAAIDFHYTPPLLVPLWGGENDRRMLLGEGIYQPHPQWFWELRPGALIDPATGERVGAAGVRGPEPARSPGRPRVAVLGDSSTFGLGVGGEEVFSRRLAALAPLGVINLGAVALSTLALGVGISVAMPGPTVPEDLLAGPRRRVAEEPTRTRTATKTASANRRPRRR